MVANTAKTSAKYLSGVLPSPTFIININNNITIENRIIIKEMFDIDAFKKSKSSVFVSIVKDNNRLRPIFKFFLFSPNT